MPASLKIYTLGHTQILHGEQPLPLLKKAQALLIYLALRRQSHSRETLAGLLWSDMPEEKARANLRTALSRIQHSLGEIILATHHTLTLANPIWMDARAFENDLNSETTRRNALAHYRGDFLTDFTLRGAPLFDEWTLLERERLRQLALHGLTTLAESALQTGDLLQATADTQHLLRLDPWRETAHRQLMRLHAERGDRAAALAQFEHCRAILWEELGVEPAPATLLLYEQIKDGLYDPHPEPVTVPHNLPAPLTSFHGRTREQTQILETLTDPARLLTLTGLGGAGKTRLALEAARALLHPASPFPDGVWYIPLAAVTTQAGLVTTIADGIGFTFSGPKPPQDQLFAYLHNKRTLLLLDNFEQLIEHAPWLTDLLRAAPPLKLLVTSREGLNLYEEFTLALDGLPFPPDDTAPLTEFEATHLFAARARRVNLTFDLPAEASAVRRICQLVEGLPLGLELAASWTRAFSPAEIADAIAHNLQALAASPQNIPERHRSLYATFEYSWNLLSDEEKHVLSGLSVFQGGFTRTAAEHVAGARARLLANLVEKSLVRRAANGRYDIHEQLRQFVWGKTAPEIQAHATAQHARYFAHFLREKEPAMTTPDQVQMLAAIHRDIENVQAAWKYAVQREQVDLLNEMVGALLHYFLKKGLQREGFRTFGEAVEGLREDTAPETQKLLGRLLVLQGRCGEFTSGDLTAPRALFEEGLALSRQYNLFEDSAQAWMGLGILSLVRGEIALAREHFQESLMLCRTHKLDWTMANVLGLLAWIVNQEGDSTLARQMCEEAIGIQRTLGDDNGVAATLTTLGKIYSDLQDYAQSEASYAEALKLCRNTGHRVGIGQALTGLFGATYRQGHYEKAIAYARESLAANEDAGDRLGEAIAYHNLGFVAASLGHHPQAVAHYEQALNIYRAIGAAEARIQNTEKHLEESLRVLQK